ncbi:MAG TPA: UDP-N-acetylmuramate:L-alanyl-gamma-D-glutamyl-meso-diaminopimelate ligase [Chthoniobacterales bacterium]|jgi:UDP-N-acetylmuramate: L-alanyl-gamma-D-glutamyl-meso-diaminopimelate ligase
MHQDIKKIHFIGICGTAMGSVAAALQEQGYTVTGSDANVYPPMSTYLEARGIALKSGFSGDNIAGDADLIVVGNAISRGNIELEEVLNRKLYYLSLPETLKEFFLRGRRNLVVTGTHGKTTTTTLLAWIFESAGLAPGYMIGGIPKNLPSSSRLAPSEHFIIEGDEYDTAFFDKRSKFVHYLPELVIVNNIEFDHADIFDDLAAIQLSFRRLLNIVPKNGVVLVNADDANSLQAASTCPAPVLRVGFAADADIRIQAASYGPQGSEFNLLGHSFHLPLVGEYNVRNAAMAISAAHRYGISIEAIGNAVAAFSGIKRRQEVRGEVAGVKVVDDFGHHPTAIKQAIAGIRHQYAGSRLWAIFEPRSNTTRRAVFQDALPEAFGEADGVYLSQIARLEQLAPSDRLDPEKVVEVLRARNIPACYLPDAASIVAHLVPQTRPGDIIVVFSNGGFDGIHDRLLAALAR